MRSSAPSAPTTPPCVPSSSVSLPLWRCVGHCGERVVVIVALVLGVVVAAVAIVAAYVHVCVEVEVRW